MRLLAGSGGNRVNGSTGGQKSRRKSQSRRDSPAERDTEGDEYRACKHGSDRNCLHVRCSSSSVQGRRSRPPVAPN